MKIIFVDYKLCTGCKNCELACAYYGNGSFNRDDSKIKVTLYPLEKVIATQLCMQCDSAPCMAVCPTQALTRDKNTNAVILDKEKCIGCKECISVCPFGNIEFNYKTKIVQKCDLCGGDPKCVRFCQSNALNFIEINEISSKRRKQIFNTK